MTEQEAKEIIQKVLEDAIFKIKEVGSGRSKLSEAYEIMDNAWMPDK